MISTMNLTSILLWILMKVTHLNTLIYISN
ncbi:UNVERIFIED_CONTAM: hypothetical protein GTU68_048361 [Idotea baltica]|nr:hypothetical protein [Idotea baltica]